jgi:zinc transport system ATP-binding protein
MRAPRLRVGYMPQRVLVDEVLPITVGRFLTLGGRASARAPAARCSRRWVWNT